MFLPPLASHSVGGFFSSLIMFRSGVRPHMIQSSANPVEAAPADTRPHNAAPVRSLRREVLFMTGDPREWLLPCRPLVARVFNPCLRYANCAARARVKNPC